MPLQRIEGLLQRFIRQSAERRWFLSTCGLLAFVGTMTAAFPVTAVVVPAVLLVPKRWQVVALACALGSTLGATALVESIHYIGWSQLYAWFPHLAESSQWQQVVGWVEAYGVLSLFVIAASPLPQTPALVFFGITDHAVLPLMAAIFFGKVLKYGLFAWVTSRFPERFYRRDTSETSIEENKDEKKH